MKEESNSNLRAKDGVIFIVTLLTLILALVVFPAKYANGSQTSAIYNCVGAITPTQTVIPYSDLRFIWPIPSTEVIQNPIITQNPG